MTVALINNLYGLLRPSNEGLAMTFEPPNNLKDCFPLNFKDIEL